MGEKQGGWLSWKVSKSVLFREGNTGRGHGTYWGETYRCAQGHGVRISTCSEECNDSTNTKMPAAQQQGSDEINSGVPKSTPQQNKKVRPIKIFIGMKDLSYALVGNGDNEIPCTTHQKGNN